MVSCWSETDGWDVTPRDQERERGRGNLSGATHLPCPPPSKAGSGRQSKPVPVAPPSGSSLARLSWLPVQHVRSVLQPPPKGDHHSHTTHHHHYYATAPSQGLRADCHQQLLARGGAVGREERAAPHDKVLQRAEKVAGPGESGGGQAAKRRRKASQLFVCRFASLEAGLLRRCRVQQGVPTTGACVGWLSRCLVREGTKWAKQRPSNGQGAARVAWGASRAGLVTKLGA